jgi:hypothetical protein
MTMTGPAPGDFLAGAAGVAGVAGVAPRPLCAAPVPRGAVLV